MRQWIALVVIGSSLLNMAACAQDSMKSPSDSPPASTMAQASVPEIQGDPLSKEVQERGLPLKPLSGTITKVPGDYDARQGFIGATENITKVGRAIQVRTKSLSTLVQVAPGLTLTQPVTISIALGGYVPTRLTQTYVSATGNQFLYNDPEGDGKPRSAFADITLSEPKPGGGIYTSTIPRSVMLDPLYNVMISPLQFTLFNDCDPVGNSEITFFWVSPDNTTLRSQFSTSSGKHVTVSPFGWSRGEVSATANLRLPGVWGFSEKDVIDPFAFAPGTYAPAPVALVPGTTRQVVQTLREGKGECTASTQYNVTYGLVVGF